MTSDDTQDNGLSAVFIAIKMKNMNILKVLRRYGADFDMSCTVGKGQTFKPMLLACKTGNIDIVNFVM